MKVLIQNLGSFLFSSPAAIHSIILINTNGRSIWKHVIFWRERLVCLISKSCQTGWWFQNAKQLFKLWNILHFSSLVTINVDLLLFTLVWRKKKIGILAMQTSYERMSFTAYLVPDKSGRFFFIVVFLPVLGFLLLRVLLCLHVWHHSCLPFTQLQLNLLNMCKFLLVLAAFSSALLTTICPDRYI